MTDRNGVPKVRQAPHAARTLGPELLQVGSWFPRTPESFLQVLTEVENTGALEIQTWRFWWKTISPLLMARDLQRCRALKWKSWKKNVITVSSERNSVIQLDTWLTVKQTKFLRLVEKDCEVFFYIKCHTLYETKTQRSGVNTLSTRSGDSKAERPQRPLTRARSGTGPPGRRPPGGPWGGARAFGGARAHGCGRCCRNTNRGRTKSMVTVPWETKKNHTEIELKTGG